MSPVLSGHTQIIKSWIGWTPTNTHLAIVPDLITTLIGWSMMDSHMYYQSYSPLNMVIPNPAVLFHYIQDGPPQL